MNGIEKLNNIDLNYIHKELSKIPLQIRFLLESNVIKYFHNKYQEKEKYLNEIEAIKDVFNLDLTIIELLEYFLRNIDDKDKFLKE